jgi:hypothetical protein
MDVDRIVHGDDPLSMGTRTQGIQTRSRGTRPPIAFTRVTALARPQGARGAPGALQRVHRIPPTLT